MRKLLLMFAIMMAAVMVSCDNDTTDDTNDLDDTEEMQGSATYNESYNNAGAADGEDEAGLRTTINNELQAADEDAREKYNDALEKLDEAAEKRAEAAEKRAEGKADEAAEKEEEAREKVAEAQEKMNEARN